MADANQLVLLDTDIGNDIDDALALAYLLQQPKCELIGITTVTGQPETRAALADAVCQAFGRDDVPIHPGAAEPIEIPQKQQDVPQAAVLEHFSHRGDWSSRAEAIGFMRDTIRAHPGEVTLLSIGPLTNVGLLFEAAPDVPAMLKKHVMMGGLYRGTLPRYGRIEWNASGDPHATARVFEASTSLYCVGLDVTTQCTLSAADFRERLNTDAMQIVREMASIWFDQVRPEITFHDPLAAASIFEPGLIEFEPGHVEIELQDATTRGMTTFRGGDGQDIRHVAKTVDPVRFFEHYFATIGQPT
jgi:purine nucleosidase